MWREITKIKNLEVVYISQRNNDSYTRPNLGFPHLEVPTVVRQFNNHKRCIKKKCFISLYRQDNQFVAQILKSSFGTD